MITFVRVVFAGLALAISLSAYSDQSPKLVDMPSKAKNGAFAAQGGNSKHVQGDTKNSVSSVPICTSVPCVISNSVQLVDKGNADSNKGNPDESLIHKFVSDPIAIFTGLLFAATVLLWRATRALVKGAERTSELQLRAYLHVKRAGATRDTDGVLWARVEIQNFGQTPAYDVVQWIGIAGVSDGDTPNIARPSDNVKTAKGIIAPGSNTEFIIPTHDRLGPEKEAALRSGKATIYVFGEIEYRDIFKTNHVTKFKMFLSGEGAAEGRFKNCEDGNEAT